MNEIGYKSKGNCWEYYKNEYADNSSAEVIGVDEEHGVHKPSDNDSSNYCIIKVKSPKSGSNKSQSSFYKIVVFYSLRIGVVNLGSTFRVTGETPQLLYVVDEFDGRNLYRKS